MTETPQAPQAPQPAPAPGVPAQRQGNGLAVAGMVLGIIALALFCAWYIAIPCAIVGLILSALGLKKSAVTGTGRGMAITGLVLSIIAVGLAIILAVTVGAMVATWFGEMEKMEEGEPEQVMRFLRSFIA